MVQAYNLRAKRKEQLLDAHEVVLHTARGPRYMIKGHFADNTKGSVFIKASETSGHAVSHHAKHRKTAKGGDLVSDIFGGISQAIPVASQLAGLAKLFGAGTKKHHHKKEHEHHMMHEYEHEHHKKHGGDLFSDILGGISQGVNVASSLAPLLLKGRGAKKHHRMMHEHEHEHGGSFLTAGGKLKKPHAKKRAKKGGNILSLLNLL